MGRIALCYCIGADSSPGVFEDAPRLSDQSANSDEHPDRNDCEQAKVRRFTVKLHFRLG